MPQLHPVLELTGAEADVDSTGDKVTFTFARSAQIIRVGIVVTGTDAGGGTIVFDKRPTAGSDTSRGAADMGSITLPASDQQGNFLYEEPSSELTVAAGDQIVCEVTVDSGTGPNFVPVIHYLPLTDVMANESDASAA